MLIVNTKGGGHGHIGLYLAQCLLEGDTTVHIHQLGNEESSEPVKFYHVLKDAYPKKFSVEYGDLPEAFDGSYDAIYDNNAKSQEDISPVIKAANKSETELFYVSSAGSYKYDPNVAPHTISDPASGPTIDIENTIKDAGVCSANFRPIYIIGKHTSKREYIDFFFDRLVRNRPIPLPGTGDELTSITDVRDVAELLASALGKGFKNQTFNCVNNRAITFNGMVRLCADACGVEPEVVNYDPAEMEKNIEGFKVKKAFPFRPRHFFADPYEAEEFLNWEPTISGSQLGLAGSIKDCYEEYIDLGLDKAEVDFSLDEKIFAQLNK